MSVPIKNKLKIESPESALLRAACHPTTCAPLQHLRAGSVSGSAALDMLWLDEALRSRILVPKFSVCCFVCFHSTMSHREPRPERLAQSCKL